MTLRRRAASFVAVVVVLPVLSGALLLHRAADAAIATATAEAARDLDSAVAALDTVRGRLGDQALLLAQRDAASLIAQGGPGPARRWLARQLADARAAARADFAILVEPDRSVLAAGVADPERDLDIDVDQVGARVTGQAPAGVLLRTRPLWPGQRFAGWLVTGRVVDAELLAALPAAEAAVVTDQQTVASTSDPPFDATAVGGSGAAVAARANGAVVAAAPLDERRRLVV